MYKDDFSRLLRALFLTIVVALGLLLRELGSLRCVITNLSVFLGGVVTVVGAL